MNAASENDGLADIQQLAGDATLLSSMGEEAYMGEEAQEGKRAYLEKRRPDFDQFPKRP
jgi:naphthoate synthase